MLWFRQLLRVRLCWSAGSGHGHSVTGGALIKIGNVVVVQIVLGHDGTVWRFAVVQYWIAFQFCQRWLYILFLADAVHNIGGTPWLVGVVKSFVRLSESYA